MSKKNQSKQTPQLSPENYIRQKARNLPIYECLVNAEWEKSKMVTVIVARVHANGNITAGVYLVDLFCLGIKDTTYMFNISLPGYKDQINKMVNIQAIPVSYELAHNIVFAGLDYAAELGLNPRKEFTSLTRYILEEDTDDVELIEIECGRNGRPFYIQGQYDSEQMVKKVEGQLERAVGKGNYDVIRTTEIDNLSDEYLDEDFEDEHDEFSDMTFEEKKDLFFELVKSMEDHREVDREKLSGLVISAFNELIDPKLVDEWYDNYSESMDVNVLPIEEIPYELWGVKPGKLTVTEKITTLFVDAYNLVNESTKIASKKVKELKKIVGDIPAVRILELMIIQVDGNEEKSIKIRLDNYAKYPDYPVFKLQLLLIKLPGTIYPKEFREVMPGIKSHFDNRTSLHEIEFMNYFLALLELIDYESNATKLEALNIVIENLELPERIDQAIYEQIMAIKFKMVIEYFSNTKI
ncbi:MAG: hypothetical protein PHT07_17925 [Paludibacter sp.]|nr:hypothetical protein [Paludibacter sp.]